MLVLSRHVGETVVIDGDIRVTVVSIQGDKVRLGFTAPASVTIDREEVHRRRTAFDGVDEPVPAEVAGSYR
jgi:carbon storage regulator